MLTYYTFSFNFTKAVILNLFSLFSYLNCLFKLTLNLTDAAFENDTVK